MCNSKRPNWDEYFSLIAKIVSTKSTCNSRHCGAVLVIDNHIISTGYNGAGKKEEHCIDQPNFPNGDKFCFYRSLDALEGERSYFCRANHAEANAIASAAQGGISVEGSTCYTTFAPCPVCLKLLTSAGIKRIVYEGEYNYNRNSKNKKINNYWKKIFSDSPIKKNRTN